MVSANADGTNDKQKTSDLEKGIYLQVINETQPGSEIDDDSKLVKREKYSNEEQTLHRFDSNQRRLSDAPAKGNGAIIKADDSNPPRKSKWYGK